MEKQKYSGVWRIPATYTYTFPKLMVHDNMVTGSINIKDSRLSLWAIIGTAINEGWKQVESGWSPEENYGYTKEDLAQFLYCLLEQRGEFGRLVLLLAEVERPEKRGFVGWWELPKVRSKVKAQLQRCIDALEQIDNG